jgi:hypothetical protein
LVGSEFSRAIGLKRETFQSGAAQVVPLRRQLARDVLGQFKCDVHKMKYIRWRQIAQLRD